MHRITLLLILFLLIPDLYIYFMYIVRKTKNIWLRIAHWIPTLLLIAGYFLLMQGIGENAMAHHAQAIGRLAICIFLFAIPKTIFMICSLVGLPFHYLLRWPRSPFTAVGLVLGIVSFFNILYGTLVGISKFEVKDIEFHHPNLPKAFDGYRIVQLSDIHIGSWIDNEKPINELVELVNAQKPDLIVFTGDLVNQRSCELEGFQDILAQLHAKDGVYSILEDKDGNIYLKAHSRIYRLTANEQKSYVLKSAAIPSVSPEILNRLNPNKNHHFRNKVYNTLYTDTRGWTWAGTPDGLELFTS